MTIQELKAKIETNPEPFIGAMYEKNGYILDEDGLSWGMLIYHNMELGIQNDCQPLHSEEAPRSALREFELKGYDDLYVFALRRILDIDNDDWSISAWYKVLTASAIDRFTALCWVGGIKGE